MTLPRARLSGPSRFFFTAVSAVLLWGLSACSDGPDKTGLAYLQSRNIGLSTPLYHFTFTAFPVDSLFPTELPLGHFAESLLVVGREGAFTASARMGFQISSQAQRDSIAKGVNLRLISLPPAVRGYSFLKNSTANRDSLTLLIEAFVWRDTTGIAADSFPVFNRNMVASFTPFSIQNAVRRVRDTARIALKAAYVDGTRDSIQVCLLKNLRTRLQADTARNGYVYLEISPLNKTGSASQDTGMFRFVGKNSVNYDPGLLLGSYVKGGSATPTLLVPYVTSGFSAVNYQVVHNGASDRLLYGVSRGINLRLNRDSLMNRIKDTLGKLPGSLVSKYFPPAPGTYDASFYVPYAEVHLPLADSLSRVDGPFALDMQMASDVDSLDPRSAPGLIPVVLGDSLTLFPTQGGSSSNTDSLICGYRKYPTDTSLRQLTLRWARDASITDTFLFAADGKRHEVALKRHTGWFRPATLALYPNSANAQVEVYFNIGSGVEPNGFVDPATGAAVTNTKSLSRRFWRPGATKLELRATRGVRALLNRVAGVAPEFLIRPADRNAYDTTFNADSTSYLKVYYPVLGEIGFPRTSGKLKVTVDVYLYPLRGGP